MLADYWVYLLDKLEDYSIAAGGVESPAHGGSEYRGGRSADG